MTLMLQIILLLAGLVVVLLGADLLVEHASRLARRWGISEFVIGATIVALGTSAPEMVVSFIGALRGNGDLAAGNVLGSNLFNTALILGLSAVIQPLAISRQNLRRDLPGNLFVTLLLVLFGCQTCLFHTANDTIGRLSGLLLLALFAGYMYLTFKDKASGAEAETLQAGMQCDNAMTEGTATADQGAEAMTEGTATADQGAEAPAGTPLRRSLLLLAAGLVMLVAGGRLFVDKACAIAAMAGLSDKFIAITVLAAGTSMPELATSCVAAAKGRTGLALGNIIGSNIANILLVLGGAALLHPVSLTHIQPGDYAAVTASAVLLFVCVLIGRGQRISRSGGLLLLALEAAYMAWLLSSL